MRAASCNSSWIIGSRSCLGKALVGTSLHGLVYPERRNKKRLFSKSRDNKVQGDNKVQEVHRSELHKRRRSKMYRNHSPPLSSTSRIAQVANTVKITSRQAVK